MDLLLRLGENDTSLTPPQQPDAGDEMPVGFSTCFPPPLFCWVLEAAEAPVVPVLTLLAVQLLHRISPWFPFFHMEDELVLQTAQHGFRPSGMFHATETGQSVAIEQRTCVCFV